VFGELPDELLTDHSGCAENAYVNFFRLHGMSLNHSEGLRPSDSPTRSLASRFVGSLRSRGLTRALVRLSAAFQPNSSLSLLKKKPAGLDGPAGVVILL